MCFMEAITRLHKWCLPAGSSSGLLPCGIRYIHLLKPWQFGSQWAERRCFDVVWEVQQKAIFIYPISFCFVLFKKKKIMQRERLTGGSFPTIDAYNKNKRRVIGNASKYYVGSGHLVSWCAFSTISTAWGLWISIYDDGGKIPIKECYGFIDSQINNERISFS